MIVGIFLIFKRKSTIAHMIQVLQPLEIGDSNTTGVYVKIWND